MFKLIDEGITSFKLFMAYPGVFLSDDATIYRAMSAAGERGGLVCMHAENGIVINEIIKKFLAEGRTAPKYHALTRPTLAEAEGVHRAIALAEMAETPVYIVHLSCTDALNQVRQARDRGIPAFAETCPQYLFLSIDDYGEGFEGAKYVMTPPLRERHNHDELWKGLKMDDLQIIATDHCPFCMKDQKELGRDDFSKIPNGAPGVEYRMELIYNGGVVENRISLKPLCRTDFNRRRENVRNVPEKRHDRRRFGCRHRDFRHRKRTHFHARRATYERRLLRLRRQKDQRQSRNRSITRASRHRKRRMSGRKRQRSIYQTRRMREDLIMSKLLSSNLNSSAIIPYFLWDEPMTVAELKLKLASASAEERTRLLGKILREARDTDVWEFTTPEFVWRNWDELSKHLGRRREFWRFLFEFWEKEGLLD